MENKPKKSKALIITLIVVVLLIIAGFLIYKNKDSFGVKTSTSIAKLFSPLTPTENKKLTISLAGEDIKKGDGIVISGTDENGNPIVMKADDNKFGFANQDINRGELGEVTINTGGTSSFWNSISGVLTNLFGTNQIEVIPIEEVCLNGATNPPLCNEGIVIFPTVKAEASLSIIGKNESSVISWTSENATSCSKGDGIEIETSGSFDTGPLSDSMSYTIICTSNNNQSSDNVYVTVRDGSNLFPSVKVTANPSSVAVGASSNITWTSLNAISCKTNEADSIGTAGSFTTGTLSESRSFTITCLGSFGMASGNVFVKVGDFGLAPECSDIIDNDSDGFIDELDASCHVDGDLNKAYIKEHTSESFSSFSVTPDLTASFVTPASALINTPTSISSIIRNDGQVSTVDGFSSFFTITNINPEDVQPGNNTLVELDVSMPALSAGTSNIARITHTFTSSGTYYIRACADKKSIVDEGLINESNEENNCGPWTTFTVSTIFIPSGLMQCSDKIDNDTDGLIDELDPNCHYEGNINNEYVPSHDSEVTSPVFLFECNDGNDNDNDNKIDASDPECHLDGDLKKAYVPEHYSELFFPITPIVYEENKCLFIEQNPLTFTDAEKAELAQLLRKFYVIAPTLKTDDDIKMVYRDIDSYNSYISRVDEVINECYAETTTKGGVRNSKYTGPTIRFGNPWYKYEDRGSYITSSVPTMKSYCSGRGKSHSTQLNCSSFKTQADCEVRDLDGKALVTGCNWTPLTDIVEYEKILNIW